MALKLLESTRFFSPNLSIYSYFFLIMYGGGVLFDLRRFSVFSPFIEKSMDGVGFWRVTLRVPMYIYNKNEFYTVMFIH